MISEELTEQLTKEQYLEILIFQQKILAQVVENSNYKDVLNNICLLAETLITNAVATIMLLDKKHLYINVLAAPSVPEHGIRVLNGLKPGKGAGSCGNAVFHNKPQYVIDTKSDERWQDLRQVAIDFNLCSCWSMPIRDENGNAVGSFALSSFEHREPSIFYKKLLEITSFIISIILKKQEQEASLKSKEHIAKVFNEALRQATDGIVLTDVNNTIIYANSALTNVLGWKPDEILGLKPDLFCSGKHEKSFYSNMWNELLQKGNWKGEIWNKRKNGDVFPEWLSISVIKNEKNEIENYLAVFTDLTQIKETENKLKILAYTDRLTSLPNRQKLLEDIDYSIMQTCVLFDINSFKEINKFFGTYVADLVLKNVAEWLKNTKYSVYHVSGDEFAILFDNSYTSDDVQKIVLDLLDQISMFNFEIEENSFSIRMTAGASSGSQKILTCATIALHNAKSKKSDFEFYTFKDLSEETYKTNIFISRMIQNALKNDKVVCHYQPILNIATNQIQKYETLVRIINDDGQIIPPLEFLSIAKQTNLYLKITRCVISQACNMFEHRSELFSVNISGSDLLDEELVDFIIQTTIDTKTSSRIIYEILETEGIENFEEVAKFIEKVKKLGSKIAIDDFGTGYSNFENIMKLNVDIIKIDGSLIKEIANNNRHKVIVETIADFAKKINATTVAEFVKDESVFNCVKDLGIDYAQGYHIGKPDIL